MMTEYRPLSIYIHVPFCVRKCYYCDFLSAPAGEEQKKRYTDCLIAEITWEAARYRDYEVQTVFIGGGTPSLLPAEEIRRIITAVFTSFQTGKEPEITIEVNPGTVSREKLTAYREMGINRLSIGLQSADNEELRLLGRIHTAEDFEKTYSSAVKSGFNNINVDLMSAIPSQSPESYRETLRKVLSLTPRPSHISAYSLIIEEGTPFYEHTPELPDEETDRLLYKMTGDILKENGYHRYEISNYARAGFECRHNKVYWQRGDYAGFGIGAASLIRNVRFHNCREIGKYMEEIEKCQERKRFDSLSLKEEIQPLSLAEQMEEYMFLGLRLTEGVSLRAFWNCFGKRLEEVYPNLLEKLTGEGLVRSFRDSRSGEERIALTEFGLDVSNTVMVQFLLDKTI